MKKKRYIPWRIDRAWRKLTAPARMLPSFVIIGAPKCGTTSLYAYLSRHPQILPAPREIQFFSNQYQAGMHWYRGHFPFALARERRQPSGLDRVITGEYTPYYLLHPCVAERIASALPKVKLIALLRNPVDRAYSHYQHECRGKHETLPFETALAREEQRLDGELERMMADPTYRSVEYQRHAYKEGGIYITHLRRYYEFFDLGQMLVIKSEDLFVDPQAILDRVTQFLGLNAYALKNPKPRNAGAYSKLNEAEPELAHNLYQYFRPYNEALYRYLDIDFKWESNDPFIANRAEAER